MKVKSLTMTVCGLDLDSLKTPLIMLKVTTITADLFTCMAVQSSLHNSWLRPSPACRGRHPLPGTSCAACRHWCRQISLPSFPDWAHTSPVVHWGVPESQGTVTNEEIKKNEATTESKLLNWVEKNPEEDFWSEELEGENTPTTRKGYAWSVLPFWTLQWYSWHNRARIALPLALVVNSASWSSFSLHPEKRQIQTRRRTTTTMCRLFVQMWVKMTAVMHRYAQVDVWFNENKTQTSQVAAPWTWKNTRYTRMWRNRTPTASSYGPLLDRAGLCNC